MSALSDSNPPQPDQADPVVDDNTSVLVNHFSTCTCTHPSYESNHLAVRSFSAPLERGAAIAVSYAIGDFGRERHVLGHHENDVNLSVTIQLGAEWELCGFTSKLVLLSEQKSAIWMDQLSILQNIDEIRIGLQRVPQIYRTFEVVVLLPYPPCACLNESLAKYKSHEDFVSEDGDFDIDKVVRTCLNAVPIASWSFRLWTKQEFRYAREISLAFCSTKMPTCMRGMIEWFHADRGSSEYHLALNKYLRNRYDLSKIQAASYGIASSAILWSLLKDQVLKGSSAFDQHLADFITKTPNFKVSDVSDGMFRRKAEFLLGARISRERGEGEGYISFGHVQMAQSASDIKDYVLAVFSEKEEYRIPVAWNSMDLCQLLDDATERYEVQWMSVLPQGLFMLEPGSNRSRPSLHIDPTKVRNMDDVYGSVRILGFTPITRFGTLMLGYRPQYDASYESRLIHSKTYQEAFGNKQTEDVLVFMRRVSKAAWNAFRQQGASLMEAWAELIFFGSLDSPKGYWPHPELGMAYFELLLHTERRSWGHLPEIDHHDVCYRLLCQWACIEPEMARQKHLGLVVSLQDPPCIGFVNGEIYRAMQEVEMHRAQRVLQGKDPIPPPEERTRSNFLFPEDWLSVHVNPNPHYSRKHLVYEAIKATDRSFDPALIGEPARDQPVAMFMTVGVWFDTSEQDPSIGAELTRRWAECDAVLI